jgi:putative selenate reductase
VPEGGEEILPADTIIPAISQEPVLDFLAGLQVERKQDGTLAVDPESRETSLAGLFAGGDVVHGPASVIQAIADGRAAAEAIGRRHGIQVEAEPQLDKGGSTSAVMDKKARLHAGQKVPVLPLTERTGFAEVNQTFTPESAALEASRCLDCDDVCSLCVTVCPNRANHAYTMAPFRLALPVLVQRAGRLVAEGSRPFAVEQLVQTLNIADFCNECGNCSTFCPTAGAPYKDKPRFWIDQEGFREAKGDAFRMERREDGLFIEARLGGKPHQLEVGPTETRYRSGQLSARFHTGTWELTGWEVQGTLAEGTTIDFTPCVTLMVLINAESVIPDLVQAAM